MPRFRPRLTPPAPPDATPPDLLTVGQLIDELMQPGHFFVAASLKLHWIAGKAEDVPWEVFRGRLVDPAHTRKQARFLSWHVCAESGDPMISVRLDVHAGLVHVTRGILCYAWEGYDSGGGVIESREVQRWTTELVGPAELDRFPDLEELRDELVCLIWQGVVGTSRLPLHSVEAPLPAFSLGQLHYCYRPWAEHLDVPLRSWLALLDDIARPELARREQTKLLEAALRHLDAVDVEHMRAVVSRVNDINQRPDVSSRDAERLDNEAGVHATDHKIHVAADRLRVLPAKQVLQLLQRMFNDISLVPYTEVVSSAIRLVCALVAPAGELPPEEAVDFFCAIIRKICRHLTAYDLVTYHHAGANYPDALVLEQFLSALRYQLVTMPARSTANLGEGYVGRHRRRALRQGCLLARRYKGHLVPVVPTSPGENARVLPAPYARVPADQLTQPHRRERRLFAELGVDTTLMKDAIGRDLLNQSVIDLDSSGTYEIDELGIGLFVDRPLGHGKEPGEPDYSPMLAHACYSLTIARKRVQELIALAAELSLESSAELPALLERALQFSHVCGVPVAGLAEPARPTAALTDTRRVADDFVIVRTMPVGLRAMLDCFVMPPMPKPWIVAMIQSPRGPVLGFFDEYYRVVMEAVVDMSGGFVRRAGIELPAAGLRVLTIAGRDVDERIPLRQST
jgi:hypothetical protein